jgi:predicted DsbA family dithiol-disulfide isomerase
VRVSARIAALGVAMAFAAPAASGAEPVPVPGLDLSDMSPDERGALDRVLKGEICPCGNAMSLAKCLQREGICRRARDVAGFAATKVRAGLSYSKVVDAVIDYLESSAKPFEFQLTDRPFKGAKDARVVLVEFADFECAHCARARVLVKKVLDTFPGKVRVHFKHYPLPFHANASNAAASVEIARERGKFWEVHDACFDQQADLSEPRLWDILKRAGIPKGSINLEDWSRARQRVESDVAEGVKAGVQGTPTFFLNGVQLQQDDYEPEVLIRRVRSELREAGVR